MIRSFLTFIASCRCFTLASASITAPMTTTAPPQAETAAPPAGRGGYRGSRGNGRGGYSHRGGRGGHHSKSARSNNDDVENAVPALEPESDDVARLRAKYGDAGQLSQLQAMFQDWSDEDLLNVLAESAGQVELAVARITEGMYIVFHWRPCFR